MEAGQADGHGRKKKKMKMKVCVEEEHEKREEQLDANDQWRSQPAPKD